MSYNFIGEINNIVENNEIQEVTKDFLGDSSQKINPPVKGGFIFFCIDLLQPI